MYVQHTSICVKGPSYTSVENAQLTGPIIFSNYTKRDHASCRDIFKQKTFILKGELFISAFNFVRWHNTYWK
jgi:hypothetical protein